MNVQKTKDQMNYIALLLLQTTLPLEMVHFPTWDAVYTALKVKLNYINFTFISVLLL